MRVNSGIEFFMIDKNLKPPTPDPELPSQQFMKNKKKENFLTQHK
jgi:hypothetical protein